MAAYVPECKEMAGVGWFEADIKMATEVAIFYESFVTLKNSAYKIAVIPSHLGLLLFHRCE